MGLVEILFTPPPFRPLVRKSLPKSGKVGFRESLPKITAGNQPLVRKSLPKKGVGREKWTLSLRRKVGADMDWASWQLRVRTGHERAIVRVRGSEPASPALFPLFSVSSILNQVDANCEDARGRYGAGIGCSYDSSSAETTIPADVPRSRIF